MTHWHSLFFLFFVQYGRAQQTFFPAAIPLAVRSPYLSCWQFTTNGSTVGSLRPTTSAHQPNSAQDPSLDSLNMVVLVRVDNITYLFLGYADTVNTTVNLTDTVISPTQTTLIAKAGPMQVNLTFLNPIEPGNWVKQSIPFSYLSLTAITLDGEAHAVQVHSHLSAEWMSANRNQVIVWNTTTTSDVVYHSVTLQNPAVFNEIATQPEWGTLHYAMKSGGEITYKIAEDSVVLQAFKFGGVLDNQTETDFRPINDRLPVFGISRDIGTIRTTQDPIVWSIGFITEPAVQYIDETGVPQNRSLFYKTVTRYHNDMFLIVDFLNDFADASSRAQQLDLRILQDAGAISRKLGDLVSLATAQVYGSIQVTVGTDLSGNLFNESDVMAFMKNIGGLKTNRVNAVETLYSAFPALMYIDPKLGGLILEPLLRFQPMYAYAPSDLGMSYPNVTGTGGGPIYDQGIEESGNMLIMTFAHARASGDGSLINRYYSVLTFWADHLCSSILPFIQNVFGPPTNDQHNLAINGIIAIKAMYNMSWILNQTLDSDQTLHSFDYYDTADNLYVHWKDVALAGDQHILAAHEQADSWVLGYNLFADVWLGTSVVEPSVYQAQSAFIDNLISTSTFSKFGMPVDSLGSDLDVVVSSSNLFVAAMTSNQDLSTNLISRVHDRASYNASAGVFPLSYNSTSGTTILGVASPAQGAMYAPLALKAPVHQITVDPNIFAPSHISMASRIALGCVGVILLVVLPISAIHLLRRWRRRRGRSQKRESVRSSSSGGMITDPGTVTPFNPMEPTLTGETPLDAGSQTDQLQRVAPVPVGLSSKELAQMRSRSRPTGRQTLTPFNPTGPTLIGAAPLDTRPQTDQQQPMTPVLVGLPSEELAQLHSRSQPTEPLNTGTQPAAPVPVDLSSDELAQLHSRSQPTGGQTLTPFNPTGLTLTGAAPLDTRPQTDQQQPMTPVPVGFSSKEPVQLRSRSRSTDRQSPSPSPSVPVGRDAVTSSSRAESQRRHKPAVDTLRREVHATISDAPPSYASEAGDWAGQEISWPAPA